LEDVSPIEVLTDNSFSKSILKIRNIECQLEPDQRHTMEAIEIPKKSIRIMKLREL